MRYREYRVGPPLDALVECIWFVSSDDRTVPPPQRVLPDGCMELIFHFETPFAAGTDAGRVRQTSSFLVGMMTRPLELEPPMTIDTMGVRFRPGGAYPFARVPLASVTDRTIDLCDLWGSSPAAALFERLAAARDDAARVAIARCALSHRLESSGRSDGALACAVGRLVCTAGRVTVAAVTREAGMSQRHLQRRFAEQVGVSPKLLARILRFQHTLRYRAPMSAMSAIDWAHVALRCGYADQAHLIRDYGQFAGTTPRSLLAAEGELSAYFTAPHRLARLFDERR